MRRESDGIHRDARDPGAAWLRRTSLVWLFDALAIQRLVLQGCEGGKAMHALKQEDLRYILCLSMLPLIALVYAESRATCSLAGNLATAA